MDKVIDMTSNDFGIKKRIMRQKKFEKIISFKSYSNRKCIYVNKCNPMNVIINELLPMKSEILVCGPNFLINHELVRLVDIESINILPKTKVIYLANPNSITGRIYSKEEVQRVLEIAKLHDLYLIIDESEKVFVKGFNDFISNYYKLIYINEIRLNTKKLSVICGSRSILSCIKKNYFDNDYSLVYFYSKKRFLDKLKMTRMINYYIIENYCKENNIIYMRNTRSSYMAIYLKDDNIDKKNLLVYKGKDVGLSDGYCIISLMVKPKKVREFIKRIT